MDGTELLGFFLVLAVMVGIPATFYGYESIAVEQADDVQVVEITAWTAENGGWTPDEIVVKKGVPVRLIIRSADITHGFYIADLDIMSEPLAPGHTIEIEFTPTEAGTYPFKCHVFCSERHQEMTGLLIVEE